MALTTPGIQSRPRWPVEPIDAACVDVDYYPPADELTLYFGGRPVPALTDTIDALEDGEVGVLVGLGPDDEDTGEVVGIHVYPLLYGAVQWRPAWARLAWALIAMEHGAEELREELPRFISDVRDLFDRFWTPAPPIEEQSALLTRRSAGELAAGGGDV